MATLMKDSGLSGLKGTVQFCADCGKPTVHYHAPGGWPICNACGYNADLIALAQELDEAEIIRLPVTSKSWILQFPAVG